MKKMFLIILMLSFTACNSIPKPNVGKCPPKGERTLADIICQEKK